MHINEFSKATGLTPRAIRLYEDIGLLKSTRQTDNRYRVYQSSQIPLGKKIYQFKALGFSINDIQTSLKLNPSLDLKEIKQSIAMHLTKIKFQIDEMNSKANHTLKLLKSLEAKKTLTKKQLKIYKAFSHATLKRSASSCAHHYLKQPSLGQDEELQLLACAYANLFLGAAAQQSMEKFSTDHKLISTCLKRIGETRLAERHQSLSKAYSRMK